MKRRWCTMSCARCCLRYAWVDDSGGPAKRWEQHRYFSMVKHHRPLPQSSILSIPPLKPFIIDIVVVTRVVSACSNDPPTPSTVKGAHKTLQKRQHSKHPSPRSRYQVAPTFGQQRSAVPGVSTPFTHTNETTRSIGRILILMAVTLLIPMRRSLAGTYLALRVERKRQREIIWLTG
jgi:hypothetical protein